MEDLNIRRACVGDIPRIDALLEQVCLIHHEGRPDLFKYGTKKYTHGQLEEIIADDSRPVFVAVDGAGYLCGYAFCIFIRHENDNILTDVRTLYIDDLCVDENLRGRHIGSALYDAVRKFAKESGCYNLTLNVWSCNVPAMKFYEACGLKPQKTILETLL